MDLSETSASGLFVLYGQILSELRERGIVRTRNAPAGDWAEYLVVNAFEGELAPSSKKSWDVLTKDGTRLQVKCRAVPTGRPSTETLSVIRTFDFDQLVVVLLDQDNYSVVRSVVLPVPVVRENATYVKHVNGYRVRPTEALLSAGEDVTDRLRAAAVKLR